jgi:uncharacterized repeat protein (TIGR03803 family)
LNSQSNVVSAPLPQFQQTPPFYVIAASNGLLAVSAPVTGVGPFSYQWLFNGARLLGATNASYVVTSASTANLGSYQLVVSNSAGAVTSAVITVSFDTDHSGLPDAWQITYFGSLGVDPAALVDGVPIYDIYADGSNPNNANSILPRLHLSSTLGGTASVSPLQPKYPLNQVVQLTAVASLGYSFIGWSGDITNTNSTVNLVMNTTKTVNAGFGLPLGQVLNATNLVWTTGGDSSWFGETNISFDGVSAAQSGVVLVGQQSWIQTTVTGSNVTEIAFQWAVSSEAEENFLNFNVNGTTSNGISGGEGLIIWQHQVYLAPPGTTVYNWDYAQNVGDNDYGWINLDAGWLDQVHVTPLILSTGYSDVIAWGDDTNGEADVPSRLTNVVGLSCGEYHSLALKSNGTVVGWGYNGDGETNVPPMATNVTEIASGWFHNLALRRDGTVVAWGRNDSGQTDVPAGLSNVVAVAGGGQHSLALKSDGTVVAWGDNSSDQSTVPSGLTNVVAIAAGGQHSLALRGDGSVVAWGDDSYGQTSIPPGLGGVTAIASGADFNLALDADGTVVAWGDDSSNQTNVISGLSNAVAIAAGFYYALALLSDGTVASWGDDSYGQTNVPAMPSGYGDYIAIAGGGYHALGLLNGGAPFIATEPVDQTHFSGVTTVFAADAVGASPLTYQWRFNGVNIAGATRAALSLTNVQYANIGTYSVLVSNTLGSVTSSNATLTVVHAGPIISSEPTNLVLVPGETAAFSVTAAGSLPLSYQWRFGTATLTGATSSALVLPDVTESQGGSYEVVITNLYGEVTSSVATLTVAPIAPNVVFSNVHTFGSIQDDYGDLLDGTFPYAALMLNTNGYLYGTTFSGGSNGYGTVFKMTTSGVLSSLYSFGAITDTNGDELDGANPYAALSLGPDSNLYGTTYSGGANTDQLGTVFRMTDGGALTSLYSFGSIEDTNGFALDGAEPRASLVLANGEMFGTTSSGGSNDYGTVFKITTQGALTTVHAFGSIQITISAALDGIAPYAALVLGQDGNLYGTAYGGGSNGYGTVFKMTTSGVLSSLYSFGAITDTNGDELDGANPKGPLVAASDGSLYGTTYQGGSNANQSGDGFGTVFRITTNGALTTLYSFGLLQDANGNPLDGANPVGGLVQGGSGALYGTTSAGGDNGNGTVFEITTNGTFLTLYRFSGTNDGANPLAGLVMVGNTLYGTASAGGSNSDGTVFSLALESAIASPELSILRSGNEVILTWPASATGFTLQSTTNLALPDLWSAVPASPVIVSGEYTVTNALTSHVTFYRLAR